MNNPFFSAILASGVFFSVASNPAGDGGKAFFLSMHDAFSGRHNHPTVLAALAVLVVLAILAFIVYRKTRSPRAELDDSGSDTATIPKKKTKYRYYLPSDNSGASAPENNREKRS
jgi:hypothetical protein